MTQTIHLFLILASLLSFDATAQWAWTDSEGRKVFSDRAPSASVPDKSIFKRPVQTVTPSNQDVSASPGAEVAPAKISPAAQSVAGKPQAAGTDKELDDRLKKAAQAQALQRKAEEDRIGKLKADSCDRARQALKTLDSGARLAQINSRGEREVMDDAARAAEAKRIQSIVDSDCK